MCFLWKNCVEGVDHSSDLYFESMPDIEQIYLPNFHIFLTDGVLLFEHNVHVVYYKCIVLQNVWEEVSAAAIPSACPNTSSTCPFSSSEPFDRFQIKQRCYIPTWHACLSLQPPQPPPAGSDSRDWYLPFTPQYLCTNAFCKEWGGGQSHGLCSACEVVFGGCALLQTWNLKVRRL